MKTMTYPAVKTILQLIIIFLLIFACISAQNISFNDIPEPFQRVQVSGTVRLFLENSSSQQIGLKDNSNVEELAAKIEYYVQDGTLYIDTRKNFSDEVDVLLKYNSLNWIKAQSVATVKSMQPVILDTLNIIGESASDFVLDLDVKKLLVTASGASTIKLKGKANELNAELSGAADLKASDLIVTNAEVNARGASDAKLFVEKKIKATTSGASDIQLQNEPEEIDSNSSGVSSVRKKNKVVEIFTEDDDTENEYETYDTDTDEDNGKKTKKFNGHWAGVELGLNMITDNALITSIPSQYSFLELNQPKSLTVQINPVEYSIPLIRNQFGIVTGIGLWINNYRFSNNIKLVPDSSTIYGFADTSRTYTKSKLTTSYITLPLLFEYQARNRKGKEIFHIAAGGYAGVLVNSKTKMVYMENSTKMKTKVNDSFHLNPFKYGLTGRVGWGMLNIFANYNMSHLFENNKEPELYTFEVGITLAGW